MMGDWSGKGTCELCGEKKHFRMYKKLNCLKMSKRENSSILTSVSGKPGGL